MNTFYLVTEHDPLSDTFTVEKYIISHLGLFKVDSVEIQDPVSISEAIRSGEEYFIKPILKPYHQNFGDSISEYFL